MSGQDSGSKPPRSGRVRHEPGGRAVWEWAIESGRHALDSTSRLLKKLEISSLHLVGDEKDWGKKKKGQPPAEDPSGEKADAPPEAFGGSLEADPAAGQRRSFNPYDSRTPAGRVATPGAAPPPRPPGATRPAQAEKKSGLLAKLFGRNH